MQKSQLGSDHYNLHWTENIGSRCSSREQYNTHEWFY